MYNGTRFISEILTEHCLAIFTAMMLFLLVLENMADIGHRSY